MNDINYTKDVKKFLQAYVIEAAELGIALLDNCYLDAQAVSWLRGYRDNPQANIAGCACLMSDFFFRMGKAPLLRRVGTGGEGTVVYVAQCKKEIVRQVAKSLGVDVTAVQYIINGWDLFFRGGDVRMWPSDLTKEERAWFIVGHTVAKTYFVAMTSPRWRIRDMDGERGIAKCVY